MQSWKCSYISNAVFSSRTYWITDGQGRNVWLVDCGDIDEVLGRIPATAVVSGVLLTHIHFDHIYGLNHLLEEVPGCRVYTNKPGREALVDPKLNFSRYHADVEDFVFRYPESVEVVEEGTRVALFEDVSADVHYTPGHDDTCLCFAVGEYLFTGDAWIPGVKTVTSFPRSDKAKAAESEQRIRQLSAGMTVCPGHTV